MTQVIEDWLPAINSVCNDFFRCEQDPMPTLPWVGLRVYYGFLETI